MRGIILCLLSLISAPALAADSHRHTWGDKTCTDWSTPVNGCQHRMCHASCTYAGCSAIDPRPERRGCDGGGRFGGGGASGEYSTAPLMSLDLEPMSHAVPLVGPWGPRPGAGGPASDACPPHDYGAEQCGGWSAISPTCKIRHCTSQCRKCLSNGRDRYESKPAGCFDD